MASKARHYMGGMVKSFCHPKRIAERRASAFAPRGATPAPEGTRASHDRFRHPQAVIKAVNKWEFPVTRNALLLTMLTAQRPGIVVSAEWPEFDFKARGWSIPAHKMKVREPHIVPLPRQR